MALIYCGIDEAGYGPLLGPLCVSMASFRVADWSPEDKAPDLWRRLAKGVTTKPGDKRGRVPVADSKKLKLPNDAKHRHPLTHLERGVLAFLGAAGARPATDADLFFHVGSTLDEREWYQGPIDLPVGSTSAEAGIASNLVATAMTGAAIELIDLRCEVVGESEYNQTVRETGTKAATTASVVTRFIADAWNRWAPGDDEVRVICDRQSGRTDYRSIISEACPEAKIITKEQSARASRYRLGSSFGITFQPEAESAHLPVALASMTAKLVRELAMGRLNRYWCAKVPELKPTAGYRQDAWRWLADAGPALSQEQRAAMIRLA